MQYAMFDERNDLGTSLSEFDEGFDYRKGGFEGNG